MWMVGLSLIGATLIGYTMNYIVRVYKLNLYDYKVLLCCLPFLLVINHLYFYSYREASSYLMCWLLSIVLGAIVAFSIEYFVLREVEMNINTLIGMLLILVGTVLLNLK